LGTAEDLSIKGAKAETSSDDVEVDVRLTSTLTQHVDLDGNVS